MCLSKWKLLISGTLATSLLASCNLYSRLSVGDIPGAVNAPIEFSAEKSVLTIDSAIIKSGSSGTLTFQPKDSSGANIRLDNLSVAFSLSGGTSTGSLGSVVYNSSTGQYAVTVMGIRSGTATTISAVVNSKIISSIVTVAVAPGDLNLAKSDLILNITPASSTTNVGVAGTVTITFTPKDENENILGSGIPVSNFVFSHTSQAGQASGTFSAISDANNGSGAYNVVFTGATLGTTTSIRVSSAGVTKSNGLPTVVVVPGPAIPLISLGSPASSPANDSTPTFNVSLTGGGVFQSSNVITLHEAADCSDTALTSLSGQTGVSAALTRTALTADGSRTFTAKVTDTLGISSCSPTGVVFNHDSTPPALPVIALSSPAASPSNDDTPTFSITLTGGGNFTSSDVMTLHEGTDCTLTSVASSALTGQTGTSALITRSAMSATTTNFRARVSDAAGNATCSSAAVSYQYDNSVPLVVISAPSRTNALSSHNVTYTITITNYSSVSFTASNAVLNTTGTASCSKTLTGSTGTYVLRIHSCTGAGTVSTTLDAAIATNAYGTNSIAVGPSAGFNLLTDNGTFAFITATAPVIASAVLNTTANNSMEKADLNADGNMDIILANKAGGARILINNGNGRFSAGIAIGGAAASPVVTDTRGVITGDFDGDTDLDIALVNNLGGRSRIYLNSNGGTTWTPGQELPSCTTSLTTVTPAMKGFAGNLNSSDTILDLVIVNELANNTCYYKGVGNGTFTYFTGTGVLADYQVEINKRDAQDIQTADLNGDTYLDFLVVNREAKTDVVCTNNGSAVFSCANLVLGGVTETLCDQSVALGDLNKDNRVDIVFGNRSSATAGCVNNTTDRGGASRFSLQNNDGTFAAVQFIANTGDNDQTYDLRLTDISGDGYLDLIRGNRNAKDSIHRWDSTANNFTTFAGGTTDYYGSWTAGSTGTYGLEVDDFDRDGLKDIVVAVNDATNAASYYYGYRTAIHTSWLASDGNNVANASAKYVTTATSALSPFLDTASANVDNLSGVTYDSVRNKYYFIRNNSFYIHETDASFTTLRDISLTGFTTGSGFDGDLEGIVYLGQSGGNSMYALTDEIGDIFIGTIPATGTSLAKSSLTALTYDSTGLFNAGWTATQKNSGAEGVAYDSMTRTFWTVREGSTSFNRSVYSFQIDAAFTTISNVKNFVWNTPADLSDIVFNPTTETLFLLSHESGKVYEMTKGGNLIGQHALTGGATPQYEGITFGPNNRLILNSEMNLTGTAGVGSKSYYDSN